MNTKYILFILFLFSFNFLFAQKKAGPILEKVGAVYEVPNPDFGVSLNILTLDYKYPNKLVLPANAKTSPQNKPIHVLLAGENWLK